MVTEGVGVHQLGVSVMLGCGEETGIIKCIVVRLILIRAAGIFLWDKHQHLRVKMFPCSIWNVLAHSAVLFVYETECQYRRGLLLWW